MPVAADTASPEGSAARRRDLLVIVVLEAELGAGRRSRAKAAAAKRCLCIPNFIPLFFLEVTLICTIFLILFSVESAT
jgi:hypothetical protein